MEGLKCYFEQVSLKRLYVKPLENVNLYSERKLHTNIFSSSVVERGFKKSNGWGGGQSSFLKKGVGVVWGAFVCVCVANFTTQFRCTFVYLLMIINFTKKLYNNATLYSLHISPGDQGTLDFSFILYLNFICSLWFLKLKIIYQSSNFVYHYWRRN